MWPYGSSSSSQQSAGQHNNNPYLPGGSNLVPWNVQFSVDLPPPCLPYSMPSPYHQQYQFTPEYYPQTDHGFYSGTWMDPMSFPPSATYQISGDPTGGGYVRMPDPHMMDPGPMMPHTASAMSAYTAGPDSDLVASNMSSMAIDHYDLGHKEGYYGQSYYGGEPEQYEEGYAHHNYAAMEGAGSSEAQASDLDLSASLSQQQQQQQQPAKKILQIRPPTERPPPRVSTQVAGSSVGSAPAPFSLPALLNASSSRAMEEQLMSMAMVEMMARQVRLPCCLNYAQGLP